MSWSTWRQRFFDEYLQWQPEEALTLGRYEGAGRLRDHGDEGLELERRWYAAMQQELAAMDVSSLDRAGRIDHALLSRVVRHHLHSWEGLFDAIDWSTYPCVMIAVQWLHAQSAAEQRATAQRLEQVPRFLEQHEGRVTRAMARGYRPDGALCEFFAQAMLPSGEAFLRDELGAHPVTGAAAVNAANAYAAHQLWLQEQVLPRATEQAHRLGERETRWRLRHVLALDDDVDAHIARAREHLAETQQQLLSLAKRVQPDVQTMADVRDLTGRMQQVTLERDADVLPTFRGYVKRAHEHLAQRDHFRLPPDYRIGVELMPRGLTATSSAANWPAPLLDSSKLGHYLVSPHAKDHSLAWAADGAVHEGLPGHHLQSFWWQRHFADDAAPVRFLLVHDQVAVPRHYWGAMPNIEGYAVYAEELMRQSDFFTTEEELFVLMAHGVRAARVVADLSLCCERMDEAEARALLTEEVGMSESYATQEVRRYLQIPLQASTYLLGRLAIEDLKQAVRDAEGDTFSEADFHERFFAYGPADPAAIRLDWLGP